MSPIFYHFYNSIFKLCYTHKARSFFFHERNVINPNFYLKSYPFFINFVSEISKLRRISANNTT